MSALSLSLMIYTGAAATVGAMVHSRGRERMDNVEPFEFLFLFAPYLTLVAMAFAFFGSVEYFDRKTPIWMYFWLLQTLSAGIMAGFILMPRYFVKADTVAAKVLVNTIGALAISGIFVFSRIFLFAVTSMEAELGARP